MTLAGHIDWMVGAVGAASTVQPLFSFTTVACECCVALGPLPRVCLLAVASTPGGSALWLPPEMLPPGGNDKLADKAADIYMFGGVLFEILTCKGLDLSCRHEAGLKHRAQPTPCPFSPCVLVQSLWLRSVLVTLWLPVLFVGGRTPFFWAESKLDVRRIRESHPGLSTLEVCA